MEQRTADGLSPYRIFSRAEWAAKRADTPMTLNPDEVTRLRSLHDRLDMTEVEEIYLPLSRLLSLYVAATQRLFRAQQNFLGTEDAKVPFIIGVAGSVAVGKSTTARVLQALLARWPNVPKVDLVTTDGFLYPNAILEREDLMEKKGFPESYDLPALLRFLSDIKAGRRPVRAPVYSHLTYDVTPNRWIEIDRPDILIVEGLNVLEAGAPPKGGKAIPYVADFFGAVEIGERARHPQHAMIAARRKPHGIGGVAQERKPARVRPRQLFQQWTVRGCVGAHLRQADRGVALLLHRAGARDARGHLAASFRRRRQDEIGGGDRRHLDVQVDTVDEGARQPPLILGGAARVRAALAGESRLAGAAAAAGVHGGDQHETRGIGHAMGRSGDRDLPDLERLAQRNERPPVGLRPRR